jgi:hypothetical protein
VGVKHLKPFVVGLSVVLALSLAAVCVLTYFLLVARRQTYTEENEWHVVDPDNVPEVTWAPPNGGDPFLRVAAPPSAGRFSQYSLSEFPRDDVQFSAEQIRSMKSFYRHKHNEGWMSGSFWRMH